MENEQLRKELAVLTALDAPSGFEEPVLRYVKERLLQVVDEVTLDVRGNLYAEKKGSGIDAPVVMVIAHADEIGFIVTKITADGFLRFAKLGGPTDMVLPGHRVRILGQGDPIEGVIGVKPGHILSGEEAHRVPPVSKLYIDISASSAEEVKSWGVETGTPVVFCGDLTAAHDPEKVFGKAVDDRAGVLALVKTAEALGSKSIVPTVVWCISVEEEIGLRGALVAAKEVQPDIVIALDTAPAGGTPDLGEDELPWRIGKGPLLKVRELRGLSTHRVVRETFRAMAEKHSIPFQVVVDTAGVTDATAAQQAGGQIAAMTIALPRRYSHSAVEMLDLRDIQALIRLLVVTIPEFTDKKALLRI